MLIEEIITEKCWKGYEKKGMKTMFGKRVPNCVKNEDVENVSQTVLRMKMSAASTVVGIINNQQNIVYI